MTKIPADRFQSKPGTMRAHLFQNLAIGLGPTLFYDLEIPLEPFDSGLEWEAQPVETAFRLEFLRLPARDWRDLDGTSVDLEQEEADGSIYLGGAHNPVEIWRMRFTRLEQTTFRIDCALYCDFEFEMVADNLDLELAATVDFQGLVVERDILGADPGVETALRASLGPVVELDAYRLEPQIGEHQVLLPPTPGT